MVVLLEVVVEITTPPTTRLHYDIVYDNESDCHTITDTIYYIMVGVTEGNKVVGLNKMNVICDLSKINVIMKQHDEDTNDDLQILFLAKIIQSIKKIELKYRCVSLLMLTLYLLSFYVPSIIA